MTYRAQSVAIALAVLACLTAGASAQQGSVATDRAALAALYNATDGANWTASTNWMSEEPLSSWHGVTTNSDGRVTAVVLNSNGLAGRLPAALGDLSALERLDLQDNSLAGALPSALANLTHLATLLLNESRALTGHLPDGLRELVDLETVNIQHTELCAPEDGTFQSWLDTVAFSGLICPPAEQSVIDVAVFYTQAAREYVGGIDEIATSIDLLVAETNTAFRTSGANLRINLVAVEEAVEAVGYTGHHDSSRDLDLYSLDRYSIDLDRLQSSSDGHMDEIHDIRDAVAADIVVLITAGRIGLASGIGIPSPSFEDRAFALAPPDSAIVFAHELGHVMGLDHDRYAACRHGHCSAAWVPYAFPYAFGYVNQRIIDPDDPESLRKDPTAPATAYWHTVMAYPRQCGPGCTALLRFSNPDQLHPDPGGDPLGKAGLEPMPGVHGPSDAVRTLNRMRGYVANFRSGPAITVSFESEQYTAAEGGDAATVTVRLSDEPGRAIDIPFKATSTTGAAASDYALPRSVSFAADDTEQTFTVTAVDDAVDDDGETVTLTLGYLLPGGVSAGSPAAATVTLADNDTVAGAPSVLSVSLTSDPRGGYAAGEEIQATVRFDRTVIVTGEPQLGLTVGSVTRQALYQGGAREVMTFSYEVVADETDPDGVSIAANALTLNGGTIRDSANRSASLTHGALADDAKHRVDGVAPMLLTAVVDGNVLTLTYDEPLAQPAPKASAWFSVASSHTLGARSAHAVAVDGSVMTVTLWDPVKPGEDVTVISWNVSDLGSPHLTRDLAGNPAASLRGREVTNATQGSYDTDDDGLIEITTLAQLDAVRHDLNGDGVPVAAGASAYRAAFPNAFPVADSQLRCFYECRGYELAADLDFDTNGSGGPDSGDTYWNDGAGWDPIGSHNSELLTRFEGNGHTVRNLFIDRPSTDYVGLFGYTNWVSAIGPVGLTQVDVTGRTRVGGLVGVNRGFVAASYSTGQVSGTASVGGLVGQNFGHVFTSYAAVRVSGTSGVGGLVGKNTGSSIEASYATGAVSGRSSVGGLVGWEDGDYVRASYATGRVSGEQNVGGLVGRLFGSTITASHWDTTTSGQTTGDLGTGHTTAQLQAPTDNTGIYAGWRADRWNGLSEFPWNYGQADEYPVLAVDFDGDGVATWQEFGNQLREGPTLTATGGEQQVALSWTAVDTTHWSPSPAVTYTVTREGDTVETVAEGISDLAFVDSGVTTGATYTYQVAAVVEGGEATRSELVTVTAVVGPALPGISITAGPSPVTEGTAATFTLTRTGPTTAELAVAVSVTESGAMLGANLPVSATFGVGDSSVTLTAATDNDDVVEANSAVTTMVTPGEGYAVGTEASASVIVEDDDAATFTVSTEPESISEGESATLTVAIANGVTFAEAQTVSLATSGTASASDYTGVPPTLTLDASASSVTAALAAATDQDEEEAETVTVTASHGGSAIGSATVTINSVSHDATLASLSLSGIDIGTFSGALTDYTASVAHSVTATTVTATATHTAATVVIEPGSQVTLAEGANEIVVTVTAEDGTTTKAYTVTVTRAALPVATIAASTTPVTEGTAATYTVTLDQAAPEALTVAVSVTESGAVLSGTPPASVSIAKGATSATLSVPTAGDSVVEADSTVTARVTAGTGYTIGTAATGGATLPLVAIVPAGTGHPIGTAATASVTVEDDDAATFMVSADPPTIREGESATLTVAIANGVTFAEEQTISLASTGTASASDSTGVPEALMLAAGADSAKATLVAAADDEEEEEAETVTVTASHAGSPVGSATVTIQSVSRDATLGSLSLSGVDIVTFSSAVTAYEVSVEHAVETISVTAPASHSGARVTVTPGPEVRLAVGSNEIVITVTAEDGTTTQTYRVTVTRAALPVATITAVPTSVTEGTAATYTVTLDQEALELLAVAVSVTQSGSVLSGSPPASVSIAKGSTSATLTVPTVGDSVVEADSTVSVTVTSGTGYTVGTASSATVTVENDDAATFTVSAEPGTVSEGGSATLTVAIANGVTFAAEQTISLATSGTASASDYTGVPSKLTVAAGATSATATLVAAADEEEEEAETVTVTASHSGSEIGSATVTINSVSQDATLSSLSLTRIAIGQLKGDASGAPIVLSSLSLTGIDIGAFSGAVTAYTASVANSVTAMAVTATASHSAATVSIEPGSQVTLAEGANPITITVTAEDGTTTQTYTVTVTRASLPVATIAAGPTPVTEGTAATYTVTLNQEAPEPLAVAVSVTQSGTVLSGSPPASVSIAKGATSATLTVPTAGDSLVGADSTVTATVTAGTGYTIGPAATASVTVEDDDAATFTVSADPPTISEGGSATLTVAIANGVTFAEAQTISLTTSGTASLSDYTGVPPTLALAAGATSATATLAAAADQAEEEDETVTVTASHGGSSVGSATVTIQSVSRDATLSSLSLSGADIGTFSGATMTYQASVANPVTATTVVATASHSRATVAIEPGAEVALAEGTNRITVTVTAEDGTTTKTYTVTVTRASLPVVSIVAVEERLLGPIGEFRLTRTGPTAEPLEAQVLFADSRTPTGRPLTVRFRAGQASVTERVQGGDNRLVEDDLTMTWTLQQGEGYAVSAEQASASLVLEESDVSEFAVTAEPPEIAEGESATVTVAITNGVRFREAQTIDLSVSGTASGSDYTVSPSTLTLRGFQTSATATLKATADQEDEAAETVTIRASRGGSAIGSATVTINSVSQDATLSSLSLSGVDIGTFSSAVTAYQASVAHEVETTTVTATASHSRATVAIEPGATVSLAEGANEITVTVTAENGTTTKTYTVTVSRAEEPAAPPVVSIAALAGRVAEGEQAMFRVTRTGSTSQPLDVQVSVTTSISSRVRTRTMRLEAGSSTSGTGYFAAQDDKVIWEQFTTSWTIQQGAGYEVSADAGSATVVVDENDVAEFALSAEPDPVAEGSSATLKLAITNGVRFAEHQAIELAATGGTASAGADFRLSGQSLTLRGSNAHVTAKLDALDDDEAEGNETVTLTARLGGEVIATQQVTIANRGLTAAFLAVPTVHDGATAFRFELQFSKEPAVGAAALRGNAFEVTGGSVTGARQLASGSSPRWEITVQPSAAADVVLTLPVPASCEADGAICTAGGGKLARAVTATVEGPEVEASGFSLAPENSRPSGIWSDGETAWVADLDDARLYAYRQSDGERQPAQDIATEPAPMGLWSDGDTIWVAGLDGGLRAHRLANGARLAARDLALEANEAPAGVWSDGETAWVSTWLGDRVHAYRLADGERLASRDIKLTGGNLMPVGLWSDGETLWVADWRERMFAYRLADGQRVSQRDVSTSRLDTDPTGLWSAGGTLLSTSWEGRKVRAYSIPVTEATLAVEQARGQTNWPGNVPTIGDPSLQAAIREALGKGPGEAVSAGELAGLESLSARNSGVRELAGLQVATNLKELDLGFNPLEDLQPLASLSALESLNLDGSALDLGPLASLQGLRRLSVRHNLLDDLQPLAALVALTELDVGDNRIEDVRALAGLAGLAVLRADRNGIADLWPLASLAGLEALDLRANRVRDLQPLAGMERLRMLRLDGNRLSELHPLSSLKGLAVLGLAGTSVGSLGPIAGLDGLRRLDLRGGSMSDLRPLRGLPSLIWVHVGGSRIEDLAPLDGMDGLTVVGQDDRESPSTGGGRAQRSKSLTIDSAGR